MPSDPWVGPGVLEEQAVRVLTHEQLQVVLGLNVLPVVRHLAEHAFYAKPLKTSPAKRCFPNSGPGYFEADPVSQSFGRFATLSRILLALGQGLTRDRVRTNQGKCHQLPTT